MCLIVTLIQPCVCIRSDGVSRLWVGIAEAQLVACFRACMCLSHACLVYDAEIQAYLAFQRVLLYCRYEVQGEYVLPSSTTLPRSVKPGPRTAGQAASRASNPFEEGAGRWRLQV